jgi:hypothetical protein
MAVFQIKFDGNDDVAMLLFSSGAYSGTPDEHLVFINVLIGFLLKLLYQKIPGLEWYTVFFCFCHFLSSGVIFNFLVNQLNQHKGIERKVILFSVMLFLVVELIFFTGLQFTTLASLIALSGIILLKEKHFAFNFLGILLFALAVCVRFHAAVLILLISLPIILDGIQLKSFKFLSILFFLAGTLLLKLYDFSYYQRTDKWAKYMEYNELRGKVNDNPNSKKLKFPTENENNNFQLLRKFFPDPRIVNLDYLKGINQNINQTTLLNKFQNILKQLYGHLGFLFLLVSLYILLFLTTEGKARWIISLGFGLQFLLVCFISVNAALKGRVYISSFLPLLFLYLPGYLGKISKKQVVMVGVLLFLFAAPFLKNAYLRLAGYSEARTLMQTQVDLIKRYNMLEHPRKIIPYGVDFNIEKASAFCITKTFQSNPVFFAGWLTGIPFPGQLKSFTEFLDSKAIFINKSNAGEIIPLLIRVMKDNYGIDASSRVAVQAGNYWVVELYPIGNVSP